MRGSKSLDAAIAAALVALALVECTGLAREPTATPTSVPPAISPTPPQPTSTHTPEAVECPLQCAVVHVKFGTEKAAKVYSLTGVVMSGGEEVVIDGLQAEISCELGEASQAGDRETKRGTSQISISIAEERTYSDTQRTYSITGTISYDPSSLSITAYDLAVTGGVFGETLQTCSMP